MKKTISILLCAILLFSTCALSAGAVSYNQGTWALRAQFSRDCGPTVNNIAIDYSYYCPEIKDEETKYPLMIMFPGLGEGMNQGEELQKNNFCVWSSDELQSRFNNGGAYIMLLRSNADKGYSWDGVLQIPSAKAAVDDFIEKHPNVDTTRIYTLGWSFGGAGSMNFAIAYPNMVAGVIAISPCVTFSKTDTQRLENTAVWLFQSKTDAVAVEAYGANTWANLKATTKNPSKIRYTTAQKAPNADSAYSHAMWHLATYDTDQNLPLYEDVKTVDGTGYEFRFDDSNKIINWLTTNTLTTSSEGTTCNHSCHKAGISALFWKLSLLFYKLFNIESKKICSCGISHW